MAGRAIRLVRQLAPGQRRQKQRFAGAVDDQDFVLRIDVARQRETSIEPARGGPAKMLVSLGRGIAAEVLQARVNHTADKRRDRVLGLADREIDRRLARLDVGEQLGEPHEGRARLHGPNGSAATVGSALLMYIHKRLRSAANDGADSGIAIHHRGGEVKGRLTIAIDQSGPAAAPGAQESRFRSSPRCLSTLDANFGVRCTDAGRAVQSHRAKRRRPRCEPGPPDGGGGAGYPPQPCSVYWTASPCSARSRPSRSTSSLTRRPMKMSTILRMISETTAS